MTDIQANNNQKKPGALRLNLPAVFFIAITCLIALSGLIGWFSDNWHMTTFGIGYVPMAPSTAILLLLLASGVMLSSNKPLKKTAKSFSLFSMAVTAVVSLMVLGANFFESWHSLQTAMMGAPETINNIPVGRMSPLTATVFILGVISIMTSLNISKGNRILSSISTISSFLSASICLAVILGYSVGLPLLYGGKIIPMALLTAISFIFFNLGILMSSKYGILFISEFRSKAKAPDHYPDPQWAKIQVISFLLISAIILASGFSLLQTQIKDAKNKIHQELSLISDFKSRQISDWYYERKDDAGIIMESQALQTQMSRFLNGQEDDQGYEQDRQELLKWMGTIEKESDYAQIILYDAKGVAQLWTMKPDLEIIGKDEIKPFWETLHSKKIVIGNLHNHNPSIKETPARIYMSIFIPVGIISDAEKQAKGVLMLHIDPFRHLYPLIQAWPTNSATAETLIVSQEGDKVVFLNELRHMKNTALRLRLPLKSDLPAAMALKGIKGVVEGIDYRNRHVLSALNDIPGTGWHIVSKIDMDEIYAPIIKKIWTEIFIIIALVLMTGMFFFIIENQRSVKFYRSTLEKEQENQKTKNALIESQQHFRTIFDQAAVGICYVDLSGKFLKVNNRFCEITAYTEEELYNITFKEITHPDDLGADLEKVDELISGKIQTYSLEKRYIRKDKSIVWINLTVSLDRFPDATPKSFISVVEDISKRIKALSDLKESEDRYAKTIEALNDGMWDWNVPSGKAYFSDHYYTMLGYKPQEFTANYTKWKTIVHPEDIDRVEQHLNNSIMADKAFNIDLRMKTKDGGWKWVATRGKAVEHDSSGSVVRMMGTLSDVSERKSIENQLIEEKERLQVTLRSIGDGVITTDTCAKITMMNKIAEDLTGWKINEAVGRSINEILCLSHKYSKKECENPALKVLDTGEIIDFESNTVLTNRNGKEISVEDSAAPIKDSDSKTIGVIIVFRDVTEKHKTEEALQNAQKLESLSILAGGIAHDFNNLLGGIFGYLDMALEFAGDKDFNGTQATISSALSVFERARDLTQQLLTFSKGGAPVRRTESISKLVRESVSFALTGSNVAMIFEIPENIWPCYFDTNQIGQVMDNIVINARQAMLSGGILKVNLTNIPQDKAPALLKQKKYVKISLSDNGPGIPKESLSHIFDPFFTTKAHGNGLGLATCYSILKRHEGMIEVETEKNKGTTFHIYLPASTEDTVIIKTETSYTFKGQGKILVMDDEVAMLKVTSAMLGRFGYETLTAADGDEAIRIIRQSVLENQKIFAAILDLTVPGGRGGKDIIKEIQTLDPSIKVIASSGYSGNSVMSDPEKFGFVACLSKPFRISELARILEGLSDSDRIFDFEENSPT
ncbi:PAS domain S-box protein [Desulforegula conservatrix]|uniref:PAS domain S-box protein n=1 Tax=Desulforegula conservatrix TaxID=153026 RepID=UPI00041D2478|nr:PAS domain S-box protein [Desulforegula conservatrix]